MWREGRDVGGERGRGIETDGGRDVGGVRGRGGEEREIKGRRGILR